MNYLNNKLLTNNAQKLRRNMTKEERHLWYDFLKSLDVTVQRQKVIRDYIVDFYIADAKLIIELDGSQHYSEEGEQSDTLRDDYLRGNGFTVLRYTNLQIHRNFREVCEDIKRHIDTSSASLRSAPSPQGEG